MNITQKISEESTTNYNTDCVAKSNNQTSILKSLLFCTLDHRLQLIEQTLSIANIDRKYEVLDNALFSGKDRL